jgi:hypothetical protein
MLNCEKKERSDQVRKVALIACLIHITRLLFFSCAPPDPVGSDPKVDSATPVAGDNLQYEVEAFKISGFFRRKNFAFTGAGHTFLVGGGENSNESVVDSRLITYVEENSSFQNASISVPSISQGLFSLLPSAAVSVTSGVPTSFAMFGGATFVEVTKSVGVRTDQFTKISIDGSSVAGQPLSQNGLSPRSSACMTGLPGNEFFIYGGEIFGNPLDSGAIIKSTGDVLPLPVAESPGGLYQAGCVYNPIDGLVYVIAGQASRGQSEAVYTFDRLGWRWTNIGTLPVSRAGFYEYAILNGKIVVLGEDSSGRRLTATQVQSDRVTALSIMTETSSSYIPIALPYWAGEASGPRVMGSFKGGCGVFSVTGAGGLPKLAEYCLSLSGQLILKSTFDSFDFSVNPAGVFAVPGTDFSIYFGTKSIYSDPLVSGAGLIIRKK